MPQYRISNAARADIVDILRLSQTQFGDQARQRYQALILAALQALADTPYRIGSRDRDRDRDELAPGLRSYHLIYSRQQAKQTHGTVKSPRHIVFYRVANDHVIEVVRLLHDAMEVQLHLLDD
ncbi:MULTISPECIES: type II toxin-antitoxin system RelE/ParE family toxin [unclassified Pseudomonas]|uniref:type II toxin-antitoxin system RelE/ParE family toxin n=1 Tax=unclassified Pseudomonas TaxID=196821 RepID=UPI00177F6208|nr:MULTISPECIES: type II toxin-antitoxin system RelE/ParE family toxin [unclassified Pseudomonas]MBD8594651.1 type II toxin-antitoxin system RelE/ParE family toxin [Pseudomonas sp. CFBP 8758]MBD8624886.1 type II toxin-antitoxin system RelE/ParE family toxin [Pseudomonas sp. CFBP 13727]